MQCYCNLLFILYSSPDYSICFRFFSSLFYTSKQKEIIFYYMLYVCTGKMSILKQKLINSKKEKKANKMKLKSKAEKSISYACWCFFHFLAFNIRNSKSEPNNLTQFDQSIEKLASIFVQETSVKRKSMPIIRWIWWTNFCVSIRYIPVASWLNWIRLYDFSYQLHKVNGKKLLLFWHKGTQN